VLHRLQIPLHPRKDRKIRITLLSRDTQYRKILNENELVKALKENPEYKVNKVKFLAEIFEYISLSIFNLSYVVFTSSILLYSYKFVLNLIHLI